MDDADITAQVDLFRRMLTDPLFKERFQPMLIKPAVPSTRASGLTETPQPHPRGSSLSKTPPTSCVSQDRRRQGEVHKPQQLVANSEDLNQNKAAITVCNVQGSIPKAPPSDRSSRKQSISNIVQEPRQDQTIQIAKVTTSVAHLSQANESLPAPAPEKPPIQPTRLRKRKVAKLVNLGIENGPADFIPKRSKSIVARTRRSTPKQQAPKVVTFAPIPSGTVRTKVDSSSMRRAAKPPSSSSRLNSLHIPSITTKQLAKPRKFVVGIDYGTTYTSASYFACDLQDRNPKAFPSDIKSIVNWPGDMEGVRKQVPTESWYSFVKKPRKKQFADQDSDDYEDTDVDEIPRKKTKTSSPTVESLAVTDCKVDNDNLDQEASYLWGYQVHHEYYDNTTRDPGRRVQRSKSMIVTTKYTQDDRRLLRLCLNQLIDEGLIRKFRKDATDRRDVRDVILDFLAEVLKHIHKQLIENEGFTAECMVEFVLTVPVIWSAFASRVLQDAMEAAIVESGFGSLSDLFIITEPEAAATFLLGNSPNIMPGESFIVLDCGGGTVDCVTYTVGSALPLRLEQELCKPSGDNCGGSYLNDNFSRRLLDRLHDEHYLDFNGQTRESIVHHLVPDFENRYKRLVDITKRPANSVRVSGLRGDKQRGLSGPDAKRFDDNSLWLNTEDYNAIFLPLLNRVANVLKEQLEEAAARKKRPKKVFLIGGFGASPSIRSYLTEYLLKYSETLSLRDEIELISPPANHDSTAIVSSGAVLRALNKVNGPKRLPTSSYGFLRVEPYQPEIFPQHKEAEPFTDPLDGERYVEVIEWFMVMNQPVPPVHEFKPFLSCHDFKKDTEHLRCEEVAYVSDFATKSHYGLTHEENRHAQEAGRIVTDLTHLLKDEQSVPRSPEGTIQGDAYYRIEYNIVPFVKGRNLLYHSVYPADASGTVQATGQISIAAAFRPGTG